ncbi:MAG: hypothetical protein AB7E76_07250 [Deferribacterales bacterium]
MKKILIFTLLSLSMLYACATGDTLVNYTIITTDTQFYKPAPMARIINSEAEYTSFLMMRALKEHQPLKDVDFGKNSVLIINKGSAFCEGCGLDIQSVVKKDGKILVTAGGTQPEEKKPEQYFLLIEKTDMKAELELVK